MSNTYSVEGEKKDLMEEDWDVLVILDACRYDYFKKAYTRYFEGGELKKAVSPATWTLGWLEKVFTGEYDDVVYISANPFVNSKTDVVNKEGCSFDARQHFKDIEDVWDYGWDEKIRSVPPQETNDAFFKRAAFGKGKRFIIHYIQPHHPYLGKEYLRYIKPGYQRMKDGLIKKESGAGLKKRFNRQMAKLIRRIFGNPTLWRILRLLNKEYEPQEALIYSKEGWKGLRKAYRENVEIVLAASKEIVEAVDGNILITADHGEFLGEGRRYGHMHRIRRAANTEVPWFLVGGKGKGMKAPISTTSKRSEKTDERIMKERLTALGYM